VCARIVCVPCNGVDIQVQGLASVCYEDNEHVVKSKIHSSLRQMGFIMTIYNQKIKIPVKKRPVYCNGISKETPLAYILFFTYYSIAKEELFWCLFEYSNRDVD